MANRMRYLVEDFGADQKSKNFVVILELLALLCLLNDVPYGLLVDRQQVVVVLGE